MLNALRLSDRGRRLFLLEGILGSIERFDRGVHIGLGCIGIVVDGLGVGKGRSEGGPRGSRVIGLV